MASSSYSASGSQYCPRWKYDVFLSFRGEDTRKTFTGHLYEGLKNRGIFTFQDDKRLEHGDSISEELLKAIEESQVAIIVFSKNYGTSRWCLNELVKIMEYKEEENIQTVIPVFYDVDPSHVRNQSGSFAVAFAEHELTHKDDVEGMQKVQRWRAALTAAANLKGYDIRDRIESDCIQHIVDQVSSKLCKASVSYLQNVVGINTHLEKVNSLLEMEVNDVRIVGIWGMGGVGKTTIARAIFDTNINRFDGACFLADIKENKSGMHYLQNILLSELLRKKDDYMNNKEDGKHMIARRLRFKKVLVVLDDIDHRDHLDNLAGDLDWFGKGSRIIATTRNKQIIGKNNVVYEVTTLLKHDAIQLFNHYAFRDEAPDEHTKELALEVVSHAKGLPLALKLWGIMLHNQDITMWRGVVDMIKRESSPDIVKNLKISFEGLQDKEKTIFLDIACFFRGREKDETIEILESYDSSARIRLHGLIEKSLVFISDEYNTFHIIQMHDLIQDMGRYVVKMQKDSGKPTRLRNIEDFEDVMVSNTVIECNYTLQFLGGDCELQETMAVEAIWVPPNDGNRWVRKEMKNMQRLRILFMHGYDSEENDGSIEYLPNNLRWFVWFKYRWELLPQNFNPTRLVYLELRQSLLHHLWNETKQLPSLRRLDLSGSKSLKRTPDFTGMPNLECLNLSGCWSLEEVCHSLGCCRKLIELNLFECASLKRFPYVNVESLKYLYLERCSSLEKLPEFLGIMKLKLKIEISCSGGYPPVNIHLQPHCINVSNCSKLESLPEEIGDLENLEKLDASYTLISRPPSSIVQLKKLKLLTFAKHESEDEAYFILPRVNEGLCSLEELDLSNCNLIDGGLPEDIGSLSSLKKLILSGNNFEHLPRSIAQLGALQDLGLSHCDKLKELPGFTGMTNLNTLVLNDCNLVDGGLPEDIGSLSSLGLLDLSGNNFEHLPQSIAQLGALRYLDLSHCDKLKELPGFTGMPNLDNLNLSYCNLIDGRLPEDIGSLSSLKVLSLRGNSFEYLPRSIVQLGALQYLDLSHCNKLKELPCFTGMPMGMPNLDALNLSYCNLIDGGLLEDIGSLSSLKKLNLNGNNFEHLPQSIAQLGALRTLQLSNCNRLKELPEIPQQLDTIYADWRNDWICNSLFQNISSLQHELMRYSKSVSDSLSLKVYRSCHWNLWMPIPSWTQNIPSCTQNIPSWFHHHGTGASVSVNLPENWYVSGNFLGFAVCYFGELIHVTAHLIPLCDDGMLSMTREFSLNHSKYRDEYGSIHFLLVPLAGLWDASKANGKTPNDYGCFRLFSTGVKRKFGVRLLYKDEAELHIGMNRAVAPLLRNNGHSFPKG